MRTIQEGKEPAPESGVTISPIYVDEYAAIQAWLDQGKILADKTIPGPWVAEWIEDDHWHEIHGQPFDRMVCPQVATIQRGGETEAEFITGARTRLPQALDALQAVLDLHKPFKWSFGYEPVTSGYEPVTLCRECAETGKTEANAKYPCPTVRAIQAALQAHAHGENDED